jgi:hypothetical protein
MGSFLYGSPILRTLKISGGKKPKTKCRFLAHARWILMLDRWQVILVKGTHLGNRLIYTQKQLLIGHVIPETSIMQKNEKIYK